MLVYEAIAETVRGAGVDIVFGLLGGGNFAVAAALDDAQGITFQVARHETAAVNMADGWARATGRVGVASVTQGPGLTNALTALVEATKSRTPLLLLAGDTARSAQLQNQDIDQDAVVRSIGAGVQPLRAPATAVEDVTRAYHRAATERRPIVLSMPLDIQLAACEPAPPPTFTSIRLRRSRPDDRSITQIADLLTAAQRPIIVGGRGAVYAGAGPQLRALGKRIGALLSVSAAANGLFAGDAFDLRIAGGFATDLAVRLFGEADLVLAVGATLNTWTTRAFSLIPETATVISVDVDEAALGARQPVTVGVVADAAATSEALLDELLRRQREPAQGFRTPEVAEAIAGLNLEDSYSDESTTDTIDPRTLCLALDRMLPPERTLAIDSGHFMGWPSIYMRVPDPQGFVFAQAYQSIGLGMGTGLGAAFARPDRLAVIVIGDGGLMMSLGELDTAIRSGLPVLVVVVDDAAYGAEVHHFGPMGMSTRLAQFAERDFAAIAEAMGARGVVVRGVADLEQVKAWVDTPEGVLLLDCKVSLNVRAPWLEEAFRAGA